MADAALAIAKEYFSRIRARDPSVADLFSEDGVLVGLGRLTRGREAIRAFYSEAIATGGPTPSPRATFSDGSRVAAEIYINLEGGSVIHAMDLFEIEDGKIRSLTYFIADHPPLD